MSEFLLGIDCGSSVTKAALFAADGHEVASSLSETRTITLGDGGVERSSDGIWTSVIKAVQDVVATSGVRPDGVVGIGCSGHGNGLYALDARGQALPVAYQSLDTRAGAIVADWAAQGLSQRLFEDGWQQAWPGQPLALAEWLRRNDPEAYEAIATIFLCKDYVNYRLTGRAVSDLTDMSAAGLLANARLEYNAQLLESLGLGELLGKLPELVTSTEVIGGLSPSSAAELGLTAGTPVVGGLFDVVASAIGSGGAAPGSLSVIAGTWSINAVVTHQPLVDPVLLMTTAFADSKRWIAIEASATSSANLSWFARELFTDEAVAVVGETVFDRCCEQASSADLRLSNPIYHPFLFGAPANSQARAGFYGIAGNHTRADLARAVLEGVVFGHRSHVDNLVAVGAAATRVRLTGGGARNAFWSQMFADVLGMRVEIPDAEETGARGAALAAGVGIGLYADVDEAMDKAVGVVRSHEPNGALAPVYAERFEIYQRLVEAMAPGWQALAGSGEHSST